MPEWIQFCNDILPFNGQIDEIKRLAAGCFYKYGVYASSIYFCENTLFFIAREKQSKVLIICNDGDAYREFKGKETVVRAVKVKSCGLNYENCICLRKIFPFTNPSNINSNKTTIGLGDRLGLASAGHLRLLKDKPVFPVLAQQSIRELNFTGRNYHDVLCAASWAVFQEGYETGFGADGDHLKTLSDVKTAIDCGYTMITLDCSEHICNGISFADDQEIALQYSKISDNSRRSIEEKYLYKQFELSDGLKIIFTNEDLKRIVLVYMNAIEFAIDIFNWIKKTCSRNIDFELSIDETSASTTPNAHFLVASELITSGVRLTSLAPKFCGEFEKGIDYRGDISQFKKEFNVHFRIAEHFGYKISIHSGSDKFAIFPAIGDITNGKFHLKTAGTNWLEAVRVIAQEKPSLYRRMHKFAISNLSDAKKFYHISADPSNIPDVDKLEDSELTVYLGLDDARQMLHITYGLILMAADRNGRRLFKDEIYAVLYEHEEKYYDALCKHIGRHISSLKV